MKKLILLGGNVISGAEIVLKDYLLKTTKEFLLLTSTENYRSGYYNMRNIVVISKKELTFLGTTKKRLKKLKKLLNLIKLTLYFRKIILLEQVEMIITNNTADILYLSFLNLNKIKVISFIHDILKKGSLLSKILKMNDKKINKYVAVSEACKKALTEIGISEDKIEVIYNGIEQKKINTDKKREKSFIFVGTLDDRKNPLEYIKFIEEISKRTEKYSAKLIYKYYDDILLEQIIKIVNEKKLKVELLKDLTREEVQNIMIETKYLFICSKNDPLPTVVLEGMNNSVFIIGKNIDGIPEMVDRETGILYNSIEDLPNIADKIMNLTKEEYEKKIFNSHEKLKSKFNNNTKVKRLDFLINDLKESVN